MRHVALLRNVNLGQPRSPTRAQLEGAFLRAGASEAASFMSNGTLVFAGGGDPADVAARAMALLAEACGTREPAFVRSLALLAALVAEDPFAGRAAPGDEPAFSAFDPPPAPLAAPLESPRGDCTIFRVDAGEAFSLCRRTGGRTGYPTPLLEAALGAPATTRAWATVVRLVRRFA